MFIFHIRQAQRIPLGELVLPKIFANDGNGLSENANKSKYYKPDDTFRDDIGKILRSPAEFIGAEYKMGGIFSTPAISNKWMIITTTEGFVYGLKSN